VFINDAQFKELWLKPERSYIVASQNVVPQLESLVGAEHLSLVLASGGKVVLTNQRLAASRAGPAGAATIAQLPGVQLAQ
jgi:hypothetical protein